MSFVAHRALANAHVQTLSAAIPYGGVQRRARGAADERWDVPIRGRRGTEGRAHALAWMHGDIAPAVVLVHGIGGSSESAYVVRLARVLFAAGFHVVRANLRGAGTSLADAPELYHAGLTGDVHAFVARAAADARVKRLALVGFSGGGNIALRAASEGESGALLDRIVSAAAPIHLPSVSRWIDRLSASPYRFYVLRALVAQARAFAELRPAEANFDGAALSRWGTLRAYDAAVIAPMHGYPSVDAYYEDASADRRLGAIRAPTLVLHADDDPMVPRHAVVPFLESRSRAVEVEITRAGGHLGWLEPEGLMTFERSWLARRVLRFLEGLRGGGRGGPGR